MREINQIGKKISNPETTITAMSLYKHFQLCPDLQLKVITFWNGYSFFLFVYESDVVDDVPPVEQLIVTGTPFRTLLYKLEHEFKLLFSHAILGGQFDLL